MEYQLDNGANIFSSVQNIIVADENEAARIFDRLHNECYAKATLIAANNHSDFPEIDMEEMTDLIADNIISIDDEVEKRTDLSDFPDPDLSSLWALVWSDDMGNLNVSWVNIWEL